MAIVNKMNFFVSHIYREGNVCADGMTNFGLSLLYLELAWFSNVPTLGGSTLGIGWECLVLDSSPFENVMV